MNGPKSVGGILSEDLFAKLNKRQQEHREKMQAQALEGETVRDVEDRIQATKEAERVKRLGHYATQGVQTTAPKKTAMRRPPECDRQPDFLVPGLYDVATKDNRSLMDVALFRLSKRDQQAGKVIRYELRDGYVEVKAGPDGMASVWDYDIVLMMISHLTESMNLFNAGRGKMPGRKFVPHVTDITKFCRRAKGGRQSDEIEAALDRLKGTVIKSVRVTRSRNGKGMEREVESEGLIGHYKVVSRTETGKVATIEIEAPNWIYNEITTGPKPDVLTVHPDYFLIDLGLGRFVYRLARRAAGKTRAKWAFRTIYERSGSTGTFKEFCRMMRKLIDANDLPEYVLKEVAGKSGPQLLIRSRDAEPDEEDDTADDGSDDGLEE
jgi:plasmid replication initiation protein